MDYAKLEAMSARQFAKNRDKVFALATKINSELIENGYGNYRGSELMQMRNDISRPCPVILARFAAIELDRRDYAAEEKRRMEYSGTLRPIPRLA